MQGIISVQNILPRYVNSADCDHRQTLFLRYFRRKQKPFSSLLSSIFFFFALSAGGGHIIAKVRPASLFQQFHVNSMYVKWSMKGNSSGTLHVSRSSLSLSLSPYLSPSPHQGRFSLRGGLAMGTVLHSCLLKAYCHLMSLAVVKMK